MAVRAAVYLLAGALALGAGLVLSRYWQEAPTAPVMTAETREPALLDQPLLDLDGARRVLREWQGKVMLINFWATWCGPCREEIPLLQQARERFRERNFEVIGIAIDEAQRVREYREQLSIAYPLLMAVDDPGRLLTRFGDEIGALPHSVVLGAAGNILSAHTGPLTADQLEKLIQTHF